MSIRNQHVIVFIVALLGAALLAACSTPAAEAPTEEAEPEAEGETMAEEPAEQDMAEEEMVEEEMPEEEIAAIDTPEGTVTYVIDSEASSAQYSVDEVFLDNNRLATAVGVTSEIDGQIFVDAANPQNSSMSTVTVDISTLESDSARRDGAIRDRFLESDTFPLATFEPTSYSGLPAAYTEGETLNFQVTGDFTVREITQEVTWDVTATVEDGTLMGTATTVVLLSDYEAGPISIAGILETEDAAALTLNFVAEPAS